MFNIVRMAIFYCCIVFKPNSDLGLIPPALKYDSLHIQINQYKSFNSVSPLSEFNGLRKSTQPKKGALRPYPIVFNIPSS